MNAALNINLQCSKFVLGDMPWKILLLASINLSAASEFSGNKLLQDEIYEVKKYLDISDNEEINAILKNNDFSGQGILSHVQVGQLKL